MSNAIAITDLSLRMGGQSLLKDASLQIAPGTFSSLMGENGSGKSSLVQCFFGTTRPQQGSIELLGMNVEKRDPETLAKIGWVLSEREFYPFACSAMQLFKSVSVHYSTWDWDYFNNLIKKLNLDPSKKVREMSLGEAAKVKLVKALAFKPTLLVLDELTANLSQKSRDNVVEAVIDLFSSQKMTVLYVCHSEEESMRLSDRVLEIKDGKIVPKEIQE